MAVGNAECVASLHHNDQLVRIFNGQRLEKERADQTEQADVDADAERQSEDGDGGEPPLLAQAAEGLTKVIHHRRSLTRIYGNEKN